MKTYGIVSALALICSLAAFAIDAPKGPHGGAIVQDDAHKFEVKMDPNGKAISVFTLRSKAAPPKKMSVTLFRDSGGDRTIELQALDLNARLPKFQGELSPNAGSVVGVELKFETSFKDLKILKLVPYIPPRTQWK